jgi:tetratricopeptide (TPR) repeat protein
MSVPRDATAAGHYAKGSQHYRDGEYAAAIEELRGAATAEPSAVAVRQQLGWVLFNSGEYQAASVEFEAAHDLAPSLIAPSFSAGASSYALSRYGHAATAFGRCVDDAGGPGYAPDCALMEAVALLRDGKREQADARLGAIAGFMGGLVNARMWRDHNSGQVQGGSRIIGRYLRGDLTDGELAQQQWGTVFESLFASYALAVKALVRGDTATAKAVLEKLAALPHETGAGLWLRGLARADLAALAPKATGL